MPFFPEQFVGHAYAVADSDFCFCIPLAYDDERAAPLLCASLIGYRTLRMAGAVGYVRRIGIYGFGAAAHPVTQIAVAQGREVSAARATEGRSSLPSMRPSEKRVAGRQCRLRG